MEKSSLSNELECQICLDLLVEPVTTMCGHTFCRICLIKFLKTKLSCAICRKPILQSIDSLTKNIGMENILKQLHPQEYSEKLKARKILYDQEKQETSSDDTLRENLPTILIENIAVFPNQVVNFPLVESIYLRTIMYCAGSDRIMVIVPKQNISNTISFLVEIISIAHQEQGLSQLESSNIISDTERKMIITIKGLKRFRLNSNQLRNIIDSTQEPPIYVSSGNFVLDQDLSNENERKFIYENLVKLSDIHNDNILSKVSILFKKKLVDQYGNIPKLPDYNNAKIMHFESLSFYFLNILRNPNKHQFFLTTNIIERIEWIISEYTRFLNLDLNPNSAYEFYEIQVSGRPDNNLRVTVLIFLSIMFFFIAYKFKYIQMR